MAKVEVVESANVNNNSPAMTGIIGTIVAILFGFFFMNYVNSPTNNSIDYNQYNYTAWKDTSGYVIQILNNECVVGKDGEAVGNVCTFEANAAGTGVAKLTVCNSFGSNCDSIELQYQSALRESFYVFGRTWYYNGKVAKN